MAQIKTSKTNIPDEKKLAGEVADGTLPYGTPPRIKNGVRSKKLLDSTCKVRPDKPVKNIH